MDFEIGNILYIVITLIAVIIGLLGRKKKPGQGGSGSPAGETRSGFMENLERVLTMGEEPAPIKDLNDFEPDLPAEEFPQEEQATEAQSDTQKGLSLMEQYEQIMKQGRGLDPDLMVAEGGIMTEPMEVIDIDEEPGTDYFEIVKDFDAGTAVVYSAIINRLDY
jgi:hypothetical protein